MNQKTARQRRLALKLAAVAPLIAAVLPASAIAKSGIMTNSTPFVPAWRIPSQAEALGTIRRLVGNDAECVSAHAATLDWLWPAMATIAAREKCDIDRALLARLVHHHEVARFVRDYGDTDVAVKASAYLAAMPRVIYVDGHGAPGAPVDEDPMPAGYFLYRTSGTAKLALGIDDWDGPGDAEFSGLIHRYSRHKV